MTGLSLFSGIGGLDLAFEWAGGQVAAMCEINPYCRKVLKKHWPNVPLFEDIYKLNKEVLMPAIRDKKYDEAVKLYKINVRWLCQKCHFEWHKTHKAKEVVENEGAFANSTIDIIYGGFPC